MEVSPARSRHAALVLVLVLFGCALGRRNGRGALSAAETPPVFWSDLGPASIDVADYPEEQRRNYRIYAAVCSRCHTLARSVNLPVVSRDYWRMYLLGMRMASRVQGEPITKDEREAILSFLEFDSKVRKIDGAESFRRQSDDLKRRYDVILKERMRSLRERRQPVINPPT